MADSANEFGTTKAASKGGKARAARLTPDQRRAIAAKGGDARARKAGKGLPIATHGSPDHPLTIGEMEIPCYVLEDGRRVLSQSGMIAALGMARGDDRVVSFAESARLSPYVSSELLTAIKNPIKFRVPRGGPQAFGYEATILADICEAVLSARDDNALQKQQWHIAKQCEILVRGFARVGIIALVDEATGYQYDRARTALEELLREFISDELRAWVKTFPNAYFRELCRLKNVPFRSDMRFPLYFGKITANVVYKRLAPGVLEALQEKNPVDEKGNRKVKHFQWLTEEVGHPKLLQHLGAVVSLMKISADYDTFKEHLDKVAPVYESTKGLLPFPDED